jgi:two-component system sensor kinase FixL
MQRGQLVGAIFDTAVDAIVVIDARGSILDANASTLRMFGYTLAELIGSQVSILMTRVDAAEHDNYVRRYLSTGQRRIIGIGRTVTGQRKDGTTFPIDLAVSEAQPGDAGDVVFAGIMRDVSERETMLRRLREEQAKVAHADKLSSVGLLAAGVAHEINNPLTGVLGCLRALEADQVAAERRAEYFDSARDAVSRIQATVRDLLDYARRRPPQAAWQMTDAVLRACLRLVQPGIRERDVRVSVAVPTDHRLYCDRAQLMQVFVNLLLNALQAVAQGGTVIVTASDPGEVRVADNGAGIAPEDLGRVCDPFFTTKPEGKGTGLGLAVTLGIIDAHGGSLTLASEPGVGTTVTVRLPDPA